MKKIYVYVLDTMAEWEVGNILQAFSMENMLKKGNVEFEVKTVGMTKDPVRTIGGLTITPDCTLSEMDEENMVALLLPGADTWAAKENEEILNKIPDYLETEILVGAICGATLALADLGTFNKYKHTSNSLAFLKMFSKKYTREDLYQNVPAFRDKNLITANSASGLLWAKEILVYLDVYSKEMLDLWYLYFSTGDSQYYMDLLALASK
ncbi:DJ-1/PfpI family protein [Enterococcus sp. AZ101]|uniref:DJ-1/PfpI family protein n=1 Tax=Enterococcus sp. AZ101 TaxID=2774742 RepID=UPI003D2AF396